MISHNEMELIALGKQLGKLLEKQDVIILSGDLGAGKTTFTKGIAKGLGIDQMIKSPTYEPSLSDAYLKIFIRKLEEGRELAFEAHGARAETLLTSFEQVGKTDD